MDDPAVSAASGTSAGSVVSGGETIDVHVHLTAGHTETLLETLDEAGVDRAVVLATPHLDPTISEPGMSGYRRANATVMAAAAAFPERLVAFLAVDLGVTDPAYVAEQLDAGACGVKLYQGHRALHERPLDDPLHHPMFRLLERRRVPVLLHVNTVRFRDELDRLLARFPGLNVVCAHMCGSRTDLDRLASIMADHPTLLFDTSLGSGVHGATGLANLEAHRDQILAMIARAPERFLFGSDLVTSGRAPEAKDEWRAHVTANRSFLTESRFRFWRQGAGSIGMTIEDYRGLALDEPLRSRLLATNARRWLGACLSPRAGAAATTGSRSHRRGLPTHRATTRELRSPPPHPHHVALPRPR
ncbi:amidohydrolase family protein [Haliangium sp.]|uniref:amidohydrolase family protein n=1 Tax=Haliangium sp. TaxID=2663208 RepID=UPI003D12C86D